MTESHQAPGASRPTLQPSSTNPPHQPHSTSPYPTLRPPTPPQLSPRLSPSPGGARLTPVAPAAPAAPAQAPIEPAEDNSVAIVDLPDSAETPSKIQVFGVKNLGADRNYKRQANVTGNGAVHVRTFHGHLSDDGLERMDNKINDFLEAHPEIEIKFATTTIGLWDGKTKDQMLIVNVWY